MRTIIVALLLIISTLTNAETLDLTPQSLKQKINAIAIKVTASTPKIRPRFIIAQIQTMPGEQGPELLAFYGLLQSRLGGHIDNGKLADLILFMPTRNFSANADMAAQDFALSAAILMAAATGQGIEACRQTVEHIIEQATATPKKLAATYTGTHQISTILTEDGVGFMIRPQKK